MTISGTTRALTGAAAITLAALGAVAPAHAATRRASDPLHGAPTVGTCSTMTARQAAARSDRSTVVPCSRTHTAEVAGVVLLPDRLRWKTASMSSLFRVVVDRCRPDVNAVLGRDDRTRDSSAYDYVWFTPTRAQRRHGARWLSCSVVRRKATVLASLPTASTPFLPDGALPEEAAEHPLRRPAPVACDRHLRGLRLLPRREGPGQEGDPHVREPGAGGPGLPLDLPRQDHLERRARPRGRLLLAHPRLTPDG
jgi:hypothetical protein